MPLKYKLPLHLAKTNLLALTIATLVIAHSLPAQATEDLTYENRRQALSIIESKASNGDVESQYLLGAMYHFGEGGVEKDLNQALTWYAIAANNGNDKARINLAVMFTDGEGVEVDYQEAIRLYNQAIAEGDPLAINNMGDMYENGYGVPQDFSMAKAYYLRAVEKNAISGFYSMGNLYKKGLGVEKNLEMAKEWYQKSCDLGFQQGCDSALEIEALQLVKH